MRLVGDYGALVGCYQNGGLREALEQLSEQLEEIQSMACVARNSLAADGFNGSEQRVIGMAFECTASLIRQVEVLSQSLYPTDGNDSGIICATYLPEEEELSATSFSGGES